MIPADEDTDPEGLTGVHRKIVNTAGKAISDVKELLREIREGT